MPYTICIVPIMPLRAMPAHTSEMVTQVVFGECMEVLEAGPDGWIRVKCQYDGYTGWGGFSHTAAVTTDFFQLPYTCFTGSWVNEIIISGRTMHIPLGCPLKGFREEDGQWQRLGVKYNGKIINPAENEITAPLIRQYAFYYLNTGYLWGGKSPFGIDCSGFTQSVYKLLGRPLPRDAWQQALEGEEVKSLRSARCGDLAFFDNKESKITHVGILLNEEEIIHSAGKVRIDKIDEQGILNTDTGIRTHRLREIRRYF